MVRMVGQHTQYILKPGAGRHDQDPIFSLAMPFRAGQATRELPRSPSPSMTAQMGLSTNAVVSYHVLHARGSLNMVSANSVVRVNNNTYSLPRRHIYGASVTKWSTIRHTHTRHGQAHLFFVSC